MQMTYQGLEIIFASICIIGVSICAYVSYLSFCVDSDDEDIIEEYYNNPLIR